MEQWVENVHSDNLYRVFYLYNTCSNSSSSSSRALLNDARSSIAYYKDFVHICIN